jgi:hypothetical protein
MVPSFLVSVFITLMRATNDLGYEDHGFIAGWHHFPRNITSDYPVLKK